MRGAPVTSLDRLMDLVKQRKCVVCYGERMPAAVVQNWQGRLLHQFFSRLTMYEHRKPGAPINAEFTED
jgi:hypothetical protein